MKTDVARGPQPAVLSRLALLSNRIRGLIDAARAAPAGQAESLLRRLALALRAQRAVDEQVLLPALTELSTDPREGVVGRHRSELLRDLTNLVGEPALSPVSRQQTLCVLDGVWMLHQDTMGDALVRHAAQLPWRMMQAEIDRVLVRWEVLPGGEPMLNGDGEQTPR